MSTSAQSFMERPRLDDENIFSPSDRQDLVNMILEYITDEIVQDHIDNFEVFHNPVTFFTKHKEYIKALEDFIATKPGGSKFVPLPKWPGITEVPSEFNVVKRKNDGTPWDANFPDTLANTIPLETEIPDSFDLPLLCNFQVVQTLFRNIELWHADVHGELGGTMLDGRSPAAAIFWPFHAFLVEIYDKWKACPNVAVIDFAFDPDLLTVPNGINVTFDFQAANHTVKTTSTSMADPITINNGGGDTDEVPQGQRRGVIIKGTAGGEIEYQCGIHGSGMSGKILISQPATVGVVNFAFEPNLLTLPSGTIVTFHFKAANHTVKTTSTNMADPVNIDNGAGAAVPEGQRRAVIINGTPGGEIEYECGIHGPPMIGKIRISPS